MSQITISPSSPRSIIVQRPGVQGAAGPQGEMARETYDPQGIEADVFDRANHTGTQPVETISGFSTAVDERISAALGTTVQAYSDTLAAWAAIDPVTKQDASPNLEAWSLIPPAAVQAQSDNLDAWAELTPDQKQDTSENLTAWSAIDPSEKQQASSNLDAWSSVAPSAKQDFSANLAAWSDVAPEEALLPTVGAKLSISGYAQLASKVTANLCTLSDQDGYLRVTATGVNSNITFPVNLSGGANRYMALRYRRIQSTHEGRAYYSTGSHSFNGSFLNSWSDPGLNEWKTVVLDMWALTAGDTDWKTNTILAVRLDMGGAADLIYDLAWVKVGHDAPWEGVDPATKQDASANLTTLADIESGAAGRAILAHQGRSDVAAYLGLPKSVTWYGENVGGGGDDSAAFQAALAEGGVIFVPPGTYNIAGTFALISYTLLSILGATVNMTVNGDHRGFHFAQGCQHAHIVGDATINHTRNSLVSPNGDFGGVFTFSNFVYGTDNPQRVSDCSVAGNFLIRCLGSQNSKPVNIYGWSENIIIEGVQACGQTNYAFVAHWTGNHSSTDVAPTKTWHPHNLTFRRCKAFYDPDLTGRVVRSFTFSACGKVILEDCESDQPTQLSWNLFCGDYGFAFAQNVNDDQHMQYHMVRCRSRADYHHVSFDGQTVGLHGAPIWTRGKSKLSIEDCTFVLMSGATAHQALAISMVDVLATRDLKIVEEAATNTTWVITLFGIRVANLHGECRSRYGTRVRDCGSVKHNLHMKALVPGTSGTYAITTSATKSTLTTVGVTAVNATSITLSVGDLVTGAGGLIRYTIGGKLYETKITGATYSSAGNVTVTVDRVLVEIPAGTSVDLVQTVMKLSVGKVTLDGYGAALLCSGSSTAKVRAVTFDGTEIKNSYAIDMEIGAVESLFVRGVTFSDSGRRGDNLSNNSIQLGADVENFIIIGNRWDKTCWRVRYAILITTGAKNGFIDGNIVEAISTLASNAAFIFMGTVTNVTVGSTINTSGEPTQYP